MFRFLLVLLLSAPFSAAGYSVLTHQANVDTCWRRCLRPLLDQRFPGATPEQWKEAKSYTYGGSIVQDMGYYPLGSKLFTDLTHYVRSGDFVRNLLLEAHNRNEYAFALGALAHYTADVRGHSEGTNRAMPSVYPDLGAQFGPSVTYFEAPIQHTQLEFAFDVVQLAAGRYRSDTYHDFIGFRVHKQVLERAFVKTYGLELKQVVVNIDLSVSTFRFAVSQLIPTAARAAWHAERDNIRKLDPRARRRDYVYRHNERQFRREYGTEYDKPGLGARIMSNAIKVLPKIGPLRPFAFKLPTPEAQKIFKQSFADVMADYCRVLGQVQQADSTRPPQLANYDFDTGKPTKAGEYALADETYGEWLRKLAGTKFEAVTPPVRQNILAFFDSSSKPPLGEEEEKKRTREKTQEALQELRALPAAPKQ
ncbi:zinc dependent phospholipase C family protein [Hymenobacter busanensis]|uniref:Zinc dependent phospholipase C family protein n=1 Tax=Hymenobacter busanensis TaxID=2607656 RepID=A0A7L4ZWP4_9BACT|nr:zinc dependent phospholipase C family protein [Hymenobacter busanensis]KAA9332377.1 zinc dependent phospholipase C family protein [Hymenobacter busanensis]QHJ07286.1 hypothetical protein GUY19_08315 [Hymenobacter busanensis]